MVEVSTLDQDFMEFIWENDMIPEFEYRSEDSREFDSMYEWHIEDSLEDMLKFLGYESIQDYLNVNKEFHSKSEVFHKFAEFYLDKLSMAQNIN